MNKPTYQFDLTYRDLNPQVLYLEPSRFKLNPDLSLCVLSVLLPLGMIFLAS